MNAEQIKAIIDGMSDDETKFSAGNNSAGSRLRKSLQAIKKAATEYRAEILAKQKAAKAKK